MASNAKIQALFMAQRACRDKDDIVGAREKLDDLKFVLDSAPVEEHYADLSRWAYEDGMLHDIGANPISAAECFRLSGEYAKSGGDQVRSLIGYFRRVITLYFGNEMDGREAYDLLKSLERAQAGLTDTPEQDLVLRANSEFNLLKRLMGISFEVEPEAYSRWANRWRSHPVFDNQISTDPHIRDHANSRIHARIAMIEGRFDEAAAVFSQFLGVPVNGLATPTPIPDIEKVVHFASSQAGEAARDYRDFGRALLKSSAPNKKDRASEIWRQGLTLGPARGNLRFLFDIERDLAAIGDSGFI